MNLSKADFAGTWKSSTGSTLVVLSDGRFTYDHVPAWYVAILPMIGGFFWEKFSGNWDLVDNSITLQPQDGELRIWKVTSFTNGELVIVNESGSKMRFKR